MDCSSDCLSGWADLSALISRHKNDNGFSVLLGVVVTKTSALIEHVLKPRSIQMSDRLAGCISLVCLPDCDARTNNGDGWAHGLSSFPCIH